MVFQPPTGASMTLTFDFNFVSPQDILFMELDTGTSTSPFPRLSGEMLLQDSSTQFNQSVLQGSGIATGTGLDGANSTVFRAYWLQLSATETQLFLTHKMTPVL